MVTDKLLLKLSTKNKDTKCSICGSSETYISIREDGVGYPFWINYNGGKICKKCYSKLVANTKYDRIRYNDRWLYFGGINIFLSFKLPRDKCEICGISKKERRIDRHHYFYCVIMPWACTIPICITCHQNITHKGRVRVKSTLRKCLICNKTDHYSKIPSKYKDGYICKKCNYKLRRKSKK